LNRFRKIRFTEPPMEPPENPEPEVCSDCVLRDCLIEKKGVCDYLDAWFEEREVDRQAEIRAKMLADAEKWEHREEEFLDWDFEDEELEGEDTDFVM